MLQVWGFFLFICFILFNYELNQIINLIYSL